MNKTIFRILTVAMLMAVAMQISAQPTISGPETIYINESKTLTYTVKNSTQEDIFAEVMVFSSYIKTDIKPSTFSLRQGQGQTVTISFSNSGLREGEEEIAGLVMKTTAGTDFKKLAIKYKAEVTDTGSEPKAEDKGIFAGILGSGLASFQGLNVTATDILLFIVIVILAVILTRQVRK